MTSQILPYIAMVSENLSLYDERETSGYHKLTEHRRIVCHTLDALIASNLIEEARAIVLYLIWLYNQKDPSVEEHLIKAGHYTLLQNVKEECHTVLQIKHSKRSGAYLTTKREDDPVFRAMHRAIKSAC